ncbi:hypothetical protein OESDEN_14916 [Oesophagostomum dentatum]|uniref:Neurotransmitter-gated ion-channel ligand-binding domain-containing protein n=1 Tax=Oesophagostomum dentatum TaxID=61180 RepID=A0A0B1SQ69_OESDE|nr:hypothetical protein OESDEN_14916 [Oesophagostomum dentatum]
MAFVDPGPTKKLTLRLAAVLDPTNDKETDDIIIFTHIRSKLFRHAYDADELLIKWNGPKPVDVNPEIRMPDMRLHSILHSTRNDTYATGIWSCALAEFQVDREIMHHLIQSYLPTSLIVVISWFSFWLDVEAVPGRVSFSTVQIDLTLITME